MFLSLALILAQYLQELVFMKKKKEHNTIKPLRMLHKLISQALNFIWKYRKLLGSCWMKSWSCLELSGALPLPLGVD